MQISFINQPIQNVRFEIKNKLWLIEGLATDELPKNVLPLNEEVLRVLEWHNKNNPRDLTTAIRDTTLKIQEQWKMANIPIMDYCYILKKVRKLHDEYASLKKSKSRESGKVIENRKAFQIKLKQLFEIAHSKAMQLMQKEDCQFLESQRKIPREGKMAGLDKSFILKANNKSRRQAAETARKEREKEACMERFLTSGLEALSTSSSSISSLDSSSSEPPMKKK